MQVIFQTEFLEKEITKTQKKASDLATSVSKMEGAIDKIKQKIEKLNEDLDNLKKLQSKAEIEQLVAVGALGALQGLLHDIEQQA